MYRNSQSPSFNSHTAHPHGHAYPNAGIIYTPRERTIEKYTITHVIETVRMLCKDQNRNVPYFPENISIGIVALPAFNEIVAAYMAMATPINRLAPV